jgi:hypothetical protein
MSLQLLKRDSAPDQPGQIVIDAGDLAYQDPFEGIRCPLCYWRPSSSSRWTCICEGTPEPFFEGCGTVWDTFSTRGRCPGCSHQWQWTTCLRCQQASLHVDWYDTAND